MIAKDTHKSVILVWGFIWMIQAVIFFALGVIVGLVSFKVGLVIFYDSFSLKTDGAFFQESAAEQKESSSHFLPVPGSSSGSPILLPDLIRTVVVSVITMVFGSNFAVF